LPILYVYDHPMSIHSASKKWTPGDVRTVHEFKCVVEL
jgi:hypothetical protein